MPTVPPGRLVVTIETGDAAEATGTLYARVAVCPPASLTCNVKLKVPAAVGVPDSAPDGLNESPAANWPEATLKV